MYDTMSVANCIKIKGLGSESTGYLFKASSCDASFVISSKHGLCHQKTSCEPFKAKTAGCCRQCPVQLSLDTISLENSKMSLNAIKIFSFPDRDLAITLVEGYSSHPLRIGSEANISSTHYYLNAYKQDDTEPGRIMLNFPDKSTDGLIYYNIESNSTPDLVEKSRGYKGVSGALVLEYPASDFPIAHAVVIENGKNNDLVAESLTDIDHEQLNNFFDCIVFHKPAWTIKLDNSIGDYVQEIFRKKVTDEFEVVTYIPSHKGFPHFNLNPIAKFLLIEFNHMLTTNKLSLSQGMYRAGNLLANEEKHEPANKLLTGRLVETYLNAPHLYSTGLTDKYYHHMHYMISPDSNYELAFSNYCGHNNIIEGLNDEIGKVISNFNFYGFNQELFLERSFLNQKLPASECETLFKVLFSEDKCISTFCLVFTVSLEEYNKNEFASVNDYIISLVNQACAGIDEEILKSLSFGLKLNLLIMPSNKINELSLAIVKELIGDD